MQVTRQYSVRQRLTAICLTYLAFCCVFGSMNLDIDEFGFIREPYELLGGDYTVKYLQQHNVAQAARTAAKSYWFYWQYRPLFSPIVSTEDKALFAAEEREFGYEKASRVQTGDAGAEQTYQKRLIVPEPDRFYSHGAGKPLLSPLLSIPQLALTRALTPGGKNLLYYQYHYDYHPIFIVTRLVQILAGLACILIVYWILARECNPSAALLGAAIVALFPTCVRFFPNIHHDAVMAPFVLAAAYFYYKGQFKRAGLCFGLALAAKNVALILVVVFAAYSLGKILRTSPDPSPAGRGSVARREMVGLVLTGALALLVLIPFANPVSYTREVLTPLTHRIHDERGENVEQFTLSQRLSSTPDASGQVSHWPEWRLVQMLFRLEDNNFFFLVIAIAFFWSRQKPELARMTFIFLLCALPFGLEFGGALNYRSLMFLPPFAVFCGMTFERRYLIALVAFLVFADVVATIDPMSADILHQRLTSDAFWARF